MDADEVALEDLDCQLMLQPAAVPTGSPIRLAKERHELQPAYVSFQVARSLPHSRRFHVGGVVLFAMLSICCAVAENGCFLFCLCTFVRRSRILVCAPSNAAIDEIVKRLTADPELGGGIFDGNGQRFTPSVRSSLFSKRICLFHLLLS